MKWAISHNPDGNIIHIVTKGEMTVKLLNQMVTEAIQSREFHASKLFLVDHRKVIVALSNFEIYNRPKELKSLGLPINSKVAVVASEESFEKFRLFETASQNRGYQVGIFKSINIAKAWLRN